MSISQTDERTDRQTYQKYSSEPHKKRKLLSMDLSINVFFFLDAYVRA